MRYVSVGRRFVSILIDGVMLGIIAGPFAQIDRGPGYFRISWNGGRVLWPGVIGIAYYVLLEGAAGATIGKFVTGIRVVKEDGSKLDLSSAVIRNLARIVDAFPYFFPYLVGAIAVWSSPTTRQRLGDRWANTVVVTKESLDARAVGPPLPPMAAPAPPASDPSATTRWPDWPDLPPPPPIPPVSGS